MVTGRRSPDSLTIKPIPTMTSHATTEVFFDDLGLPADALIAIEGKGFRAADACVNTLGAFVGRRVLGMPRSY